MSLSTGDWDALDGHRIRRWRPRGDKHVDVHEAWLPGFTVNEDTWGRDPKADASLILHESMHQLPPYFGHDHINRVEREFLDLVYTRDW